MVPQQCNLAEQSENIGVPAAFPQHKGNFGELKKTAVVYLTGFETLPNFFFFFGDISAMTYIC